MDRDGEEKQNCSPRVPGMGREGLGAGCCWQRCPTVLTGETPGSKCPSCGCGCALVAAGLTLGQGGGTWSLSLSLSPCSGGHRAWNSEELARDRPPLDLEPEGE